MPDWPAPVAQNVTGGNGLQSLAQILSLKQQQIGIAQQQVALSTQQQQLSSATSQAQLAQIQSSQQQALRGVNWAQYENPDGSLNIEAATKTALTVAPNEGPGFITRLSTMAQNTAAAKKAYLDLNTEEQAPIRAALAQYGQAGSTEKLPDLAANLRAYAGSLPKSDQAGVNTIIDHALQNLSAPDPVTGAPASEGVAQARAKGAALRLARMGLSPSEAAGPGGLATPSTGTVSTGGAIVPIAQSRTTGAVTGAPGALPTTIGPQIVTQPGTNAKYIAWPNGEVTPLGAAGARGAPGPAGAAGSTPGAGPGATGQRGGTNWWQPGAGQEQLLTANTAALAGRIQAGEQAANASPQALDALTRARAILDQGTWTGGTFSATKDLRNLVAGLGVDTTGAQNASELAKNLARYEAARAGSVGSTDAARSLYEAGAPNTKMDAKAVKAVVMQSLGLEKMIQGYAKVVGSAATPQAAMAAEQKFRSVPGLVQIYELGFMRNKAEADAMMSRYGLTGKQVAAGVATLRQLGAL